MKRGVGKAVVTGVWDKRPTGCKRTISGMHIPRERRIGYQYIELYCRACGLVDDTNEFSYWLFGELQKLDDSVEFVN